MKKNFATANKT